MATFDLDSLKQEIDDFCRNAPRILRQSAFTLDLADELERAVSSANKSVFKLAVVGQWKAGKSTLINALVGEDVAITEVTEATATINRLLFGTPDQAKTFRVIWKDGHVDIKNREQRDQWIGNSELARKTSLLEFFCTAEFLKRVEIYDTPGLGSTYEFHEEATRDFFFKAQQQNEQDTDCVLYVLKSLPREGDRNLLHDFGAETRLPNTSPYNSIAVLHKWEALLLKEPKPWLVAEEKAGIAFNQLKECVSAVIPVSAPLKLASQICNSDFWAGIVHLIRETTPSGIKRLLSSANIFDTEVIDGCLIEPSKRRELHLASSIGSPKVDCEPMPLIWACFATILKLAAETCFSDGESLRKAVEDASGVNRLMELLENRFFARASLIRSSNLFSRILRPAEKARIRLRQRRVDFESRASQAAAVLAELERRHVAIPIVREFIDHSRTEAVEGIENVTIVLRELETESRTVGDAFDEFTHDLDAVQLVDRHADEFQEQQERIEILRILGTYGSSIEHRLAGIQPSGDDWLRPTQRYLEKWTELRDAAESTQVNRRAVLAQVISRLRSAIQFLARRRSTEQPA